MTAVPILRPSQAPRWYYCAGSFALEGLFPEAEDSPEAREGTAAHHYVTETLEGRPPAIGSFAPNGHPIDADMVRHGHLYIEDVEATMRELVPSQTLFRVETKVAAHRLVHPECEGTPDTFAVNLARRRLVIWDYKYGHGFVDAWMNWQLVAYFAGVIEGLDLTREDVADLQVSLRVVQPRNYHRDGPLRVWGTTGAHLWGLVEQLRLAAYAAKQPGAPTVTGEHCDNCSGRHACDALKRVGGASVDKAGSSVPDPLPPDALGLELARLRAAKDRLSSRLDGLEEHALALMRQGKTVPGWAMGSVNSRERFATDPAQVFALAQAMGVKLQASLPPLGEVKSAFKAAGLPEELLKAYTEKPAGTAKLVPADTTAAAKAFG